MLHKKRSNSKSQWKIAFIAPFLLAFIFLFNTKVIAQKNKEKRKEIKITVEVYAMGFDKESNKDDLKKISKTFKEKGLNVKFSDVKRNDDKQITAIQIEAESSNGKTSASYSTSDSNGINPVQISFDNENNNLNIGSSEKHNMHKYSFSNKGNNKMVKHRIHKKGDNTFIVSDDDNNAHSTTKIWVNKNGDTTKIKEMVIDIHEDYNGEGVHEIIIDDESGTETEIIKVKSKKGDNKGNFIFISEDNDDKNTTTTYIVNGKKMSKAEFKKFDKDKIKTIEIKKEVKKKK